MKMRLSLSIAIAFLTTATAHAAIPPAPDIIHSPFGERFSLDVRDPLRLTTNSSNRPVRLGKSDYTLLVVERNLFNPVRMTGSWSSMPGSATLQTILKVHRSPSRWVMPAPVVFVTQFFADDPAESCSYVLGQRNNLEHLPQLFDPPTNIFNDPLDGIYPNDPILRLRPVLLAPPADNLPQRLKNLIIVTFFSNVRSNVTRLYDRTNLAPGIDELLNLPLFDAYPVTVPATVQIPTALMNPLHDQE